MIPHARDPHAPLLRWLSELLADLPNDRQLPVARLENVATSPWSSITFSGHRHLVDLHLEGDAADVTRTTDALQRRLDKADPTLPGSVLIDCRRLATVTKRNGAEVDLSFELLTLED
jgi:hypothetical protein